MSPTDPDAIADCVLNTFAALPTKCKPRRLPDEWVPIAGIVLTKEDGDKVTNLTCAALATGMKCLPQEKVTKAQGGVLHDWHAEVLALRVWNRWIVDECAALVGRGQEEGEWVKWARAGRREKGLDGADNTRDGEHDQVETELEKIAAHGEHQQPPPFEIQDGVSIHMYVSAAPCGDASMELTMAEQEDATPWSVTSSSQPEPTGDQILLGRGHFDKVGIVRRKPSRPDAPAALSKSCSDKLALKQCTGILSSLTSMLVRPERAYLSTIVLPASQHVPEAVERAFSGKGRMEPLLDLAMQQRWRRLGYEFKAFELRSTSRVFAYAKPPTSSPAAGSGVVPSNLTAVYTPHQQEVLINGVLQGRKQFDSLGASCVSRRCMWKAALQVGLMAGLPVLTDALRRKSYGAVKACGLLEGRDRVKQEARDLALKGWRRNEGDDGWGLEDIGP